MAIFTSTPLVPYAACPLPSNAHDLMTALRVETARRFALSPERGRQLARPLADIFDAHVSASLAARLRYLGPNALTLLSREDDVRLTFAITGRPDCIVTRGIQNFLRALQNDNSQEEHTELTLLVTAASDQDVGQSEILQTEQAQWAFQLTSTNQRLRTGQELMHGPAANDGVGMEEIRQLVFSGLHVVHFDAADLERHNLAELGRALTHADILIIGGTLARTAALDSLRKFLNPQAILFNAVGDRQLEQEGSTTYVNMSSAGSAALLRYGGGNGPLEISLIDLPSRSIRWNRQLRLNKDSRFSQLLESRFRARAWSRLIQYMRRVDEPADADKRTQRALKIAEPIVLPLLSHYETHPEMSHRERVELFMEAHSQIEHIEHYEDARDIRLAFEAYLIEWGLLADPAGPY